MHPSALAAIAFDITEERVREAERLVLLPIPARVRPNGRSRLAAGLARIGVGVARAALRVDRAAARPVIATLQPKAPQR